ncbi:hypothetical protein PMSD_28125 [Paenibacillus macquariensis subsp. defensor]|nr:hypothetical protein PMSD_28125 [Paenibacillus macquariensis subsp. defensor]
MELFPSATEDDIRTTKAHLSQYPKMRRTIDSYLKKQVLTITQQHLLKFYTDMVYEIDSAIEQILDDEVKSILEHRYIKAKKHKLTIATYQSTTSISTINRRIDAGVETIAECLKLSNKI